MIRDAIFIDETNRKTRPVEFKESGIIVEGLLVAWPQITISLGGNRHELLFLKFPQHNLYVRLDPELKKFLRNLKVLELSSVIDIGRKRKVIEISLVLTLVFIVVLFFMRLPWIHAKVVDGAVELLPYETEREIGKAINEKVDFSPSHPREAEIETALKKIGP